MGRPDAPKRLDHDAQLALELRVCRAYQIPHSQFLGWSHDDRSKAIWELARSAQVCSGCGTRAEEWQPEHGGHLQAHRAVPEFCPGCHQLEALQATLRSLGDQERRGYHVKLIRNEEVRHARLDAA